MTGREINRKIKKREIESERKKVVREEFSYTTETWSGVEQNRDIMSESVSEKVLDRMRERVRE